MKPESIAILLALSATAHSSVIVSDNFSSPSAGSEVSSSVWVDVNNNNTFVVRDQSTSTAFGSPENFGEAGGANLRYRTSATLSATLMTVSFDFFEPATASTQPTSFGLSDTDNDLNAAGANFAFSLNNGTIALGNNTVYSSGTGTGVGAGVYSVGSVYTISMVYNRSGAVVSDYIGTQDLANGSLDLWIFNHSLGSLSFLGNFTTTNASSVARFMFRNFSTTPANTLYVDNFSIDNSIVAPVPEVSSSLVGALGMTLLFRRRR